MALIAVGIISIYASFFFQTPLVQPASPKPGGGGNGGGGNNANGGGPTADTQAPTTLITLLGHGYTFNRSGVQYYSGSVTVTLNATDNDEVDSIYLQDNDSFMTLPTLQHSDNGHCSWTWTTLTAQGLHMLQYYSVDKSGNTESPQTATAAIGKPSLSDLSNLISNSGVDNAGIKNALQAKVNAAEGQQARGEPMNSLNALANQLNALDGKHGLDSATVSNMESMITAILTP